MLVYDLEKEIMRKLYLLELFRFPAISAVEKHIIQQEKLQVFIR